MNEGLQATTGQENTGALIKQRKWKCIGHIFRKERLLFLWNPPERRKGGRLKQTWRLKRAFDDLKVLG